MKNENSLLPEQDTLRFITCGSVDDGKSTFIGRLLWESQQIFEDQLDSLRADSKKFGTQGNDIDFALLVDGLAAEREQGITIDVAYRYFCTTRRRFIVADTPGHEQYTRNMVTGASTAQLAVLLVDARHGLLTQTKRHAFLASVMGIKNVILAINKMDLVNFSQSVYQEIADSFSTFAKNLKFSSVTAIPISALLGDNIFQSTTRCPWFQGPSVMQHLESVSTDSEQNEGAVFPIQWVNRPNSGFRGYSGTLARGSLKVGDQLRVTSTGHLAVVSDLRTSHGDHSLAQADDAITVCLNRELDISRGEVLTHPNSPLETTDQFEATLIWLHEDTGMAGRSYELKLCGQWTSASITNIKHTIDVNTLTTHPGRKLNANDIAVCTLATTSPLIYDTYENSKALGSFILVDRISHSTLAAGTISHSLRRAQNIYRHAHSITPTHRERLNGHPGMVVWFTGLSGAGKSTLANALEVLLHERGIRTFILDGDNLRHGLNKDLGFTEEARVENIRRVSEVAKMMADAGLVVMTAFISPFLAERETARQTIGQSRFLEIFVSTSLETCESRDTKGLYKKARSGLLPNMTGINSPYELPVSPDLAIDTTGEPVDYLVRKLLDHIISRMTSK
jgi:bifunctional enzyme CysN/CysC